MRVQYFLVCLVAGIISTCIISIQLLGIHPLQVEDHIQQWNSQKSYILADQDALIANDFDIPENMRKRVEFWFDIYSRYSGYHKVIHHNLYPWIVYEVVDVRGIPNSEKYMKRKIRAYQKTFKELAKKQSGFTKHESELLLLLQQAPDRKKAIRTAANKIRYQTGQRDSIEAGLIRSQSYLPHMEVVFEEKGLPTELTRLPFVESSFSWKVYSRVGAAGMWQFMKKTGRKFMRINKSIDERMSPMKSTEAAALLLNQNNKILYNSWPLAVTAYNHGPTGLRRAVRKVGSKDLATIITDYKHRRFSFASANFYSCFLAVLYVEKYKKLLFPDLPNLDAYKLQEQMVTERMKAQDLLTSLNYESEKFLELNPDFSRAIEKNYYVPRGTRYFLPADKDSLVADNSL